MTPLFNSLQSAASAAIAHENLPGAINIDRWATTYRCSPEQVREALETAANGSQRLPEEAAPFVPVIVITEDGGGK